MPKYHIFELALARVDTHESNNWSMGAIYTQEERVRVLRQAKNWENMEDLIFNTREEAASWLTDNDWTGYTILEVW